MDRALFSPPGEDVALRPDLIHWFEAQRLYPRIVGEFEDSALLKGFRSSWRRFVRGTTAIADYVIRQYGVEVVGRIEAVTEQLYAITTERRLLHPAIVAVVRHAARVFGKSQRSEVNPDDRVAGIGARR